jgi:hypothetical protein
MMVQSALLSCATGSTTRAPVVGIDCWRRSTNELTAGPIAGRLLQGTLDLSIASRLDARGALQFESLYNEEMVLVVHRPPMVLLPASFVTRQMLDECFRSCGAEPQVMAEINTPAPIMGLVAQSARVGTTRAFAPIVRKVAFRTSTSERA